MELTARKLRYDKIRYDTIRYIYVCSKADGRVNLILSMASKTRKLRTKLKTKTG